MLFMVRECAGPVDLADALALFGPVAGLLGSRAIEWTRDAESGRKPGPGAGRVLVAEGFEKRDNALRSMRSAGIVGALMVGPCAGPWVTSATGALPRDLAPLGDVVAQVPVLAALGGGGVDDVKLRRMLIDGAVRFAQEAQYRMLMSLIGNGAAEVMPWMQGREQELIGSTLALVPAGESSERVAVEFGPGAHVVGVPLDRRVWLVRERLADGRVQLVAGGLWDGVTHGAVL